MKKNAISIAVAIIAFAFFFIACGGEEPKEPVDNDQNDEEVIVDNEESDDATDNEESDDIVDSEPSDDQPDELIDEENPDEDQVVTNFCEKMLDIAGDWYKVEGGDKITMTLVSQENTCEVTMTWQQGWTATWHGLELPLEKVYDSETESYYALKKSGENLVRKDTLKDGSLSQEIVFAR